MAQLEMLHITLWRWKLPTEDEEEPDGSYVRGEGGEEEEEGEEGREGMLSKNNITNCCL